jgi:hypothetical protein
MVFHWAGSATAESTLPHPADFVGGVLCFLGFVGLLNRKRRGDLDLTRALIPIKYPALRGGNRTSHPNIATLGGVLTISLTRKSEFFQEFA